MEIHKAKLGSYDIWEVRVECFEDGCITEIKNGSEDAKKEKVLVKSFTNYFGVGTDAQISYIAQRLRAKNIMLKKIAYGLAGLLSFFMFCGSLSWKIKRIFQIGKKRELAPKNQET
jgi:hypothetical protein